MPRTGCGSCVMGVVSSLSGCVLFPAKTGSVDEDGWVKPGRSHCRVLLPDIRRQVRSRDRKQAEVLACRGLPGLLLLSPRWQTVELRRSGRPGQ